MARGLSRAPPPAGRSLIAFQRVAFGADPPPCDASDAGRDAPAIQHDALDERGYFGCPKRRPGGEPKAGGTGSCLCLCCVRCAPGSSAGLREAVNREVDRKSVV